MDLRSSRESTDNSTPTSKKIVETIMVNACSSPDWSTSKTEKNLIESYGASPLQLESLRKRLVAVPFHLFTGEGGSDEFQRRLKKLLDTKMNGRNQNQKKKNK